MNKILDEAVALYFADADWRGFIKQEVKKNHKLKNKLERILKNIEGVANKI